MYYEFYIDVFFVVNLLVDFLVLCLTNRILGETARPLQSFGAAFIGAAGTCLFFVLSGEISRSRMLAFYSVMVLFMVRAGCGFKTRRKLFWGVCVFHGAAFLMGGFLSAVPDMAGRKIVTFSAVTVMAYGVLDTGIRLCRYLKGRGTARCEVLVALGKKEVKVKGLYDTGNCLYDRETGKPVCVMEYGSFCMLLEKEQQEALGKFCAMTETGTGTGQTELLLRLRPHFLLYTSVGCQRGMLPVVTADSLTVLSGEKKRQIREAAIGLSRTKLSPYGNFQMIISPTILDS